MVSRPTLAKCFLLMRGELRQGAMRTLTCCIGEVRHLPRWCVFAKLWTLREETCALRGNFDLFFFPDGFRWSVFLLANSSGLGGCQLLYFTMISLPMYLNLFPFFIFFSWYARLGRPGFAFWEFAHVARLLLMTYGLELGLPALALVGS